jgi:Cu-Zn family superoxide dismutase
MKRIITFWTSVFVIAAGLVGCATNNNKAASKADAVAVLSPTQGNDVRGTIYFTKVSGGVRIDGEVTGLKPGSHGFHIHEKGDCSAPDAASAGGHYNPTKMPHGSPSSAERHMGDFGNIEANSAGIARFSRIDRTATLEGENSVIGHGVIVHADPDDLKSQPAGNAGKRVACGVIEKR